MRGHDGRNRDHGCNVNVGGNALRRDRGNDNNCDGGAPTQELRAVAVLRRTQTGSQQGKAMQHTFGLRELASQHLSKPVAANLTEPRGILLQGSASRQSLLPWRWRNSRTPHNNPDWNSFFSRIHTISASIVPPVL